MRGLLAGVGIRLRSQLNPGAIGAVKLGGDLRNKMRSRFAPQGKRAEIVERLFTFPFHEPTDEKRNSRHALRRFGEKRADPLFIEEKPAVFFRKDLLALFYDARDKRYRLVFLPARRVGDEYAGFFGKETAVFMRGRFDLPFGFGSHGRRDRSLRAKRLRH